MVLAVAAYLVVGHWSDLRAVSARIGLWPVIGSAVLGLVGTALIVRVWHAFLVGVGVAPPRADVDQVFFVTQLGKYLPGSVWPVIAQMEAGRRWGAGRSTMLVASALMLVMLTATGLGLGIALLPWSSNAGLRAYWWTIVFLLPLGALLHPKVLPWLLDRGLQLMHRDPAGVTLSGLAVGKAGAWSLAVWAVLGAHIYVMMAALGARGTSDLATAVGGMALAWAVGLIVIPAPAGAGVRDTVLVLTIGPVVGSAEALTLALASRVILLCADLALAAASMMLARRARRRRAPSEEMGSSEEIRGAGEVSEP